MIQDAIRHYHDLFDDSLAAETQDRIHSLLKERRLFFGDRALCTVLRPHFYSPEQFQYLKMQTETLLKAFAKTHAACMKDPQMRGQFFLAPWEEEMMQLHPPEQVPWTTSRLDSFFSLEHGSLQFVEYNAETPAGMAYEDVLAETFLDLSVMEKFQEIYRVTPLSVRGHLLEALVQTYRQWNGKDPDHPLQIAIVDWDDVPTKNEHYLSQDWFNAHGCPAIVTDPRNLEYRNQKLWDGDFRVDLIYKRVLGAELFERMGSDNAIFRALRDRSVCISNSFQALLLYKKSSLAFVSDEINQHLFTTEEIDAIHKHIPWTRVVQDRSTTFEGKKVDLLDFISSHREDLVLKPNDAYGGKGVILGWEASPEEWNAGIRTALREPHVVQRKVFVASEPFAVFQDGHFRENTLFVDADPFIFMGTRVHGVLTRLSSAALLNVTAGHGSTVPSFLVEKK